jgi:iron complex transport system substrate-binding protein
MFGNIIGYLMKYAADAYKNGHIVYLTPDVWYLAEGGITATDVMLRDLE